MTDNMAEEMRFMLSRRVWISGALAVAVLAVGVGSCFVGALFRMVEPCATILAGSVLVAWSLALLCMAFTWEERFLWWRTHRDVFSVMVLVPLGMVGLVSAAYLMPMVLGVFIILCGG